MVADRFLGRNSAQLRLNRCKVKHMQILPVRHRTATVYITYDLIRFITDWMSAQQKFISGITQSFHGLRKIRAGDFTLTPAFALRDLRCTCRIFGDAGSLVLRPDALHLEFEDVRTTGDQSLVSEAIRRASGWFVDNLGDQGLDFITFQTLSHMEALNVDGVESYLGQFERPEVGELVKKDDSSVECVPTTRLLLSDSQAGWRLHRVVEKSELIDAGIFVDTRVQIRGSHIELDDQLQLLSRASTLADRAVGLEFEAWRIGL